ncbi:methyltransferase domain-containing protein, partial [Streptomyces sp. SID3212]|uniref:methyltransferase domain-containing protein n=1 Tax=Streptomyces sp. SID3212 TaxID=2690259 RepID=UPI0013706646
MTRTLVQHHTNAGPPLAVASDPSTRARDWAEIQERMLVPLYEAVYERLEVRAGTRLLGLGCGSGLALLMAAGRGARVMGVDSDEELLTLASARLGAAGSASRPSGGVLPTSRMAEAALPGGVPYDVITALQPIGCVAGDAKGLA